MRFRETVTIDQMERRGFFGVIAGFAATAVLDPERDLWVPGKKLISIPSPLVQADVTLQAVSGWPDVAVGDVLTFGCDPRQWHITAVHSPGRRYSLIQPG